SLSKFELSQTKFQLTQTNFSATQGCGEPTLQEATAGAGYAATLRREFAFLRHKFSLRTMDARLWQTGSHRPQSAAPLRLAQLAAMFHKGLTLRQILETTAPEALRRLLQAAPADFWRTHYTLDVPAAPHSTALSAAAADLMLINAAAPLICAYGRAAGRVGSEQQALALWASLGPERNRVTTAWAGRGLQARSALESQAQLQIEAEYCRAERCADCPVRAWCAVGARQPEKDS
ncbi:MAG: DUF2851 family protein, partial [Prevotellaceae bacterium]|nr:DUF2851 family protein [Prevotellaceae bacterium]